VLTIVGKSKFVRKVKREYLLPEVATTTRITRGNPHASNPNHQYIYSLEVQNLQTIHGTKRKRQTNKEAKNKTTKLKQNEYSQIGNQVRKGNRKEMK